MIGLDYPGYSQDTLCMMPDTTPFIALVCESLWPERQDYVQLLAKQAKLPLLNAFSEAYPFLLTVTDEQLELRCTNLPLKPIAVDFLSPQMNYRRLHGGGKAQLIAKAVGIKGSYRPKIIDATAGLGTDSFVLAILGCQVMMLERAPVIALLLQDGLTRLHLAPGMRLDLSLVMIDAITEMGNIAQQLVPDVIYLDPMFPEKNKSSLAKKELRILRSFVGNDEDADELLNVSLNYAAKRVVVKRHRLDPPLGNRPANLMFVSQSTRFDVYLKYTHCT